MKYTDIKWVSVEPLEDESTIQEVEDFVGYKFPELFKEHVKKFNSGRPFDSKTNEQLSFDTMYGEIDDMVCLASFNKSERSNIWNNQYPQEFRDELFEDTGIDLNDFVFFSYTPGGDAIGFKKATDEIILYVHDADEIWTLAPDFKSFLESLFV